MARVTWAPDAIADLREIQRFIARDSARAAASEARRIRAAVRRLEAHPESGRLVPELRPRPFREVIVAPYRVVYRYLPEHNRVRILAVVHSSRQFPSTSFDD